MLQTVTAAAFVIILSVPVALRQRHEGTPPPDFYVQITARRSVFYSDEYIHFLVMSRANRRSAPNCDFGQSGTLQVLRNENVIKTFPAGPVSRTGIGTRRGLQYVYYGWGLSP